MGKFKITDLRNEVKIGLIAGDHEYAIEYKNNKFWFNGVAAGLIPQRHLSNFDVLSAHLLD